MTNESICSFSSRNCSRIGPSGAPSLFLNSFADSAYGLGLRNTEVPGK